MCSAQASHSKFHGSWQLVLGVNLCQAPARSRGTQVRWTAGIRQEIPIMLAGQLDMLNVWTLKVKGKSCMEETGEEETGVSREVREEQRLFTPGTPTMPHRLVEVACAGPHSILRTHLQNRCHHPACRWRKRGSKRLSKVPKSRVKLKFVFP